jgi:hypothetical protein
MVCGAAREICPDRFLIFAESPPVDFPILDSRFSGF